MSQPYLFLTANELSLIFFPRAVEYLFWFNDVANAVLLQGFSEFMHKSYQVVCSFRCRYGFGLIRDIAFPTISLQSINPTLKQTESLTPIERYCHKRIVLASDVKNDFSGKSCVYFLYHKRC